MNASPERKGLVLIHSSRATWKTSKLPLIDSIPSPTPLRVTSSKPTQCSQTPCDASVVRKRIDAQLAAMTPNELVMVEMFTLVMNKRGSR